MSLIVIRSPGATALAPAGTATAAATTPTKGPDTSWVVVAFGAVTVSTLAGWGLHEWIKPAFTEGAGFSAFAPLYILAQAIERLIEPFAGYLAPDKSGGTTTTKQGAETLRNAALVAAINDPTQVSAVATAQGVLDKIRRNTTVVAWGLASVLAILACGAFGIQLMSAIGFDVPPYWDIAITGIAVGSGTKPLHDLISNIQKSKDQKSDPPETQTAS